MSEVDAPPAEKTVKAEVEEKPSPMATEEQSVAATITEEPTSTTENAAAATTTAAATPAVSENTPSWDHSDRRVMLQGVYKYHDTKQCRKLVEDMIETIKTTQGTTLEIHKTKKAPKQSWVSVTFSQVEMVQPFIDYVNNNDLKSRNGIKLFAKRAASNERKRRGEDSSDRDGKRQKLKAAKAEARRPVTEEEIKDRMCPLWRLSEEEQRSQKLKNMIKKCSMKIIQEIKGKFRNIEKEQKRKVPFYDWIAQKRSIVVDEVVPVPSPVRNKVEFTFGYRYIFDETTGDQPLSDAEPPKVPAVGFMILGWAGGVSKPHCCPTIGPEFCAVSDLVDTFLKDSPLLPYDSIEHKGFWRFLTIRASRRTRECMVTFVHSPACGGRGETVDFSDDVVKEKARLVALLKDAKLPVPDQEPIEITSISFQEYEGLSAPKPDDPAELAYGKPTLEERLGKCTFHISPGAFFQVNTPGAEILYGYVVEKVREVSSDPQNTLLFDVCCGTGTIGISCMKEGVVGKVVGVDISEPAILDAQNNAGANGYTNEGGNEEGAVTRFVASRAEHVMDSEIAKAKKAKGIKFVAVVDPARDGLHADVIRALRSNEKIRRIVYVSCNPTGSLIKDAGYLCQPPTKKYSGTPFRVVSATPVDMFPLTAHCEMVMTFDRLDATDTKRSQKESAAMPPSVKDAPVETAADKAEETEAEGKVLSMSGE